MRNTFILVLAALATAGAAAAQTADPVDRVLSDIAGDGYEVRLVERTWLGRVRILAGRAHSLREVVVDPRNGEILRDMTQVSGAEAPVSVAVEPVPVEEPAVAATDPLAEVPADVVEDATGQTGPEETGASTGNGEGDVEY
ncbi:hypothetical protein HKCCE2091_06520 [Rhodobacterales bacterium HKCCE2091]|nr:hypothetical protein [Rhodobacterales bacterium HKCCE2091]